MHTHIRICMHTHMSDMRYAAIRICVGTHISHMRYAYGDSCIVQLPCPHNRFRCVRMPKQRIHAYGIRSYWPVGWVIHRKQRLSTENSPIWPSYPQKTPSYPQVRTTDSVVGPWGQALERLYFADTVVECPKRNRYTRENLLKTTESVG